MNGYSRKPETSCTSSSSEIEIAPREFRRRTASFVSSRCRTRANNTPVHATQASFLSIDSRRFCEPNDERVSDEKHRRPKPKVCVANRNAKQFWVFTERSASAAATFVTSAGSGNDSELVTCEKNQVSYASALAWRGSDNTKNAAAESRVCDPSSSVAAVCTHEIAALKSTAARLSRNNTVTCEQNDHFCSTARAFLAKRARAAWSASR
mmetsp:Transcript_8782/g.29266  ORF Transcript_8782/g.29266 Transcript_8782/m.29266 type:complete len:209 (+) Transcript_8782:428-1054(+)